MFCEVHAMCSMTARVCWRSRRSMCVTIPCKSSQLARSSIETLSVPELCSRDQLITLVQARCATGRRPAAAHSTRGALPANPRARSRAAAAAPPRRPRPASRPAPAPPPLATSRPAGLHAVAAVATVRAERIMPQTHQAFAVCGSQTRPQVCLGEHINREVVYAIFPLAGD